MLSPVSSTGRTTSDAPHPEQKAELSPLFTQLPTQVDSMLWKTPIGVSQGSKGRIMGECECGVAPSWSGGGVLHCSSWSPVPRAAGGEVERRAPAPGGHRHASPNGSLARTTSRIRRQQRARSRDPDGWRRFEECRASHAIGSAHGVEEAAAQRGNGRR